MLSDAVCWREGGGGDKGWVVRAVCMHDAQDRFKYHAEKVCAGRGA